MRWSNSVRSAALVSLLSGVCAAQQLIGYVPKRDANVTGSTDELDGQAVLVGSAGIVSKDRTASVKLTRGGTVNVCQTSELKITESREVSVSAPLLFSLDSGAIEIATNATSSDSIMTPDLRFTIRNSGPLDLRIRVARNGDTCVDNRGASAPTLAVSDPFGESMYELSAGQHVLFQHGSVGDVMPRETTPCGCVDKGSSMAEALLASGANNSTGQQEPATPAAAQHPFPVAPSAGPESTPQPAVTPEPAPEPPPGAPQISDTLSYSAAAPGAGKPSSETAKVTTAPASPAETSSAASNAAIPAAPAPVVPAPPRATPKPVQPPVNDVVHIVARVFHKLFGSH